MPGQSSSASSSTSIKLPRDRVVEITEQRKDALSGAMMAAGLGLATGLGASLLFFRGSRTPVLVGLAAGIGYGASDAMHRLNVSPTESPSKPKP